MSSSARLPNLVIVGVAKAGTTSLFHYLGQHPDICPSDVKELRYFNPLHSGEALAPLDSYSSHFRHCDEPAYAMEATPGYFYGGFELARGIRDTCPGVRTLAVLRAPDDRCWSFYRFVKTRLRIPKAMTFSQYLDRCEELHRAGTDLEPEHGDFSGLIKGCYARWLDAWTQVFDDDLRVLFFDDMARNPRATLKSTLEWLGLDAEVVDQFQLAIDNKTVQYRNQHAQRAAVWAQRRSQRLFHNHQTAKRVVRTGYHRLNKAASDERMTAADRQRLKDFYRGPNLALAAQLGQMGLSLPPGWS